MNLNWQFFLPGEIWQYIEAYIGEGGRLLVDARRDAAKHSTVYLIDLQNRIICLKLLLMSKLKNDGVKFTPMFSSKICLG